MSVHDHCVVDHRTCRIMNFKLTDISNDIHSTVLGEELPLVYTSYIEP